jgi:tetratricopeptide (TPR) repeat protein
MAKRWKQQDATYLKRYAKIRLLSELAERFKTTPEEVEKKLKELLLASKDGRGHVPKRRDPLVKIYERGIKALHQGKWREAVKHLDRVVEESDEPDLVGQARRLARVCREKLGGTPKPKDDDPFLTAVYERNRGNLEEALAICSRGGRQSKDERFAYLAASLHSLMGDWEKAAKFLEQAIELNPKNRIHAFHDADFEDLRADPEYRELFF